MDASYISGLSALGGAVIGGLASFTTSWMTQRTQLRNAHTEAELTRIEGLYSEFIAESARLVADALSHQKGEIANMVRLYALVGRMRLVSAQAVVAAADQIIVGILRTYQEPNLDLQELRAYVQGGRLDFFVAFGEAARRDLLHRR